MSKQWESLADVRAQQRLDDATVANATLQLKVQKLSEENEKLRQECQSARTQVEHHQQITNDVLIKHVGVVKTPDTVWALCDVFDKMMQRQKESE